MDTDEQEYECRQMSKFLARNATKSLKDYEKYREQAKYAVKANKIEYAKVFAQYACNLQNNAHQMSILSAQMDCAAASLKMGIAIKESAAAFSYINEQIHYVYIDPVKIAKTMLNFQSNLANLNMNMQSIQNIFDQDVIIDSKANYLLEQLYKEVEPIDIEMHQIPVEDYAVINYSDVQNLENLVNYM